MHGMGTATKSWAQTAQCKTPLVVNRVQLLFMNRQTLSIPASFAPFHAKSDILYAFAPDLCRSLGASYVRPSSYQGVPTGFYTIDFGDLKVNDDSSGFILFVACGNLSDAESERVHVRRRS